MNKNTEIAVPLYYEIYLQDLSNDYIDLTLLGRARTREEAATCCRLFKEALQTAQGRDLHDKGYRANCTIFFRPILKGVNNEHS